MVRKYLPILCLMTLTGLAGCTARTQSRLVQPDAPYSQRELRLQTDRATFLQRGGRCEYLLEFPLPGSTIGVVAFRLFITAPGDSGEFDLASGDAGARGFLLQEVGALRGKTVFSSGRWRARRDWLRPDRQMIDFELEAAGGVRLVGAATVSPGGDGLRAFRLAHQADIAALVPTAAGGGGADEPPTQPEQTNP